MRLLLLRHGQAEASAPSDAQRRLIPAGERAVLQQRRWLVDTGIGAIYCSPYRRARDTAALIRAAVGDIEPIFDARLTPDEPVSAALDLLQAANQESLLVVGHNPLLSQLAGTLIGDPYAISLPTAGLVCLEADGWFPGSAQLLWQK